MSRSGWRDGIYLSLSNTLFSYEKAENASECCEWRSVPVRGRDLRVRQNTVERSRQFPNVPEFSKMFQNVL